MRTRDTAGAGDAGVSSVPRGRALKVSHLDLRDVTSLQAFEEAARRAAELHFSHLCIGPLFDLGPANDPLLVTDHRRTVAALASAGSPPKVLQAMARACDRNGLSIVVDIVLDRMALDGASARELAGLYAASPGLNPLDPRIGRHDASSAILRDDAGWRAAQWWTGRLTELISAGAKGFRLLGLRDLPRGVLGTVIEAVPAKAGCAFWAWTPGLDWSRHAELAEAGVSAVFASTCWWDGRAAWHVEEIEALRRVAPVLGIIAPPFGEVDARPSLAHLRRDLTLAAATTQGLFLSSAGLGHDLSPDIIRANALADELACGGISGEVRCLTGPGDVVSMLVRVDNSDARAAGRGVAILVNTDRVGAREVPIDLAALPPAAGVALGADGAPLRPLSAEEVRVIKVAPSLPVATVGRADHRQDEDNVRAAAAQPPIVIDRISPRVSGGPFAAKHIVGRPLTIEADIFADGHDLLAAEVQWSSADDKERLSAPLTPVGNDRWRATITPRRIGRHYITVEAWRDEYGSLCHALDLKHRAGVDVAAELAELVTFLRRLPGEATATLAAAAKGAPPAAAVALLTAPAARGQVASVGQRRFRAQEGPLAVEVERPQAEFAAWYELFPRSLTDDAFRHGTFDDVIAALPRVRAMGFDVLYFPPIHPIGRTNRKGRNNSLSAGPDDPGSPYATGGEGGGHDAIHPALGTPGDFRRLIAAARGQGLEIALDFAIQCSPDHPWLRDHPGWFRRRPDGSIKYAENPPKKYEDIVNVDFHADEAVPGLWLALRDVVLHWVGEGIRIFRVDNPHTKPLSFWQWMIGDVRGRHPDVIFLSEAFTRPKMMYRLAKIGFSQSYTYFTWRNAKQEITDYLRELATTEVADYFRPHFFVNTPDINPFFLQGSGRAGFLIRAALAATLSGLWGVYSGFELCEAAALPGREEYLDSEKYEIRPRDFSAPGNIVAEITLLNRLRKAHPALHSHLGVSFYNAFNDQVMVYGKRVPGAEDMVLVAVSLDPHQPQEAAFEVPLWEWQLPDDGAVDVEDLVRGDRWVWQGKNQHLRLDPAILPFAIWRITPRRPA
jgi:starch synthase (maltosyl-transferring)